MKRDWTGAIAKVEGEGKCRNCGKTIPELRRMGRKLEAAHILGRTYDLLVRKGVRYVVPHAVIPLCGPQVDTGTCHNLYDGHELDLWEKLKPEEQKWACGRLGEGRARRRISGRGWSLRG